MKEVIPSVFMNDSGTFMRLECFEDGKLVDRITVKVDKTDEERLIDFFYKSKLDK